MEMMVPKEIADQPPQFLQWARTLLVESPDQLTQANDGLRRIKEAAKRTEEFFKPMKRAADEAKKKILDAERQLTGPLNEAEAACKGAISSYLQAEERKRLEEQQRLQAQADEEARRQREALEKRAAQAKRPETQQRHLEAAQAIQAPVVHIAPSIPKVDGLVTRKIWKARVVDATQVPREFLTVNEKALDAYAKATKGSAQVPGVMFYEEQQLASR